MLETGIPCFVQTKFSFNILATKNSQTSVNYFKLVVFLYFFGTWQLSCTITLAGVSVEPLPCWSQLSVRREEGEFVTTEGPALAPPHRSRCPGREFRKVGPCRWQTHPGLWGGREAQ